MRGTIRIIEAKGCAPWLSGAMVPDHLHQLKTTVQYGPNGEVEREWKRLIPGAEEMREFVAALCEDAKGKGSVPKRKERKTDTDQILFELDLYDAHLGMYASEKETLDKDYDCDIAARRMVEAAEGLASRSSRPKKCMLVFGGDMMHSDTRNNRTEQSGNALDVDTRFQRVVSYLVAASKDVVKIASSVAQEVEIVIIEGNHSWHSEVWLAQVLDAYYSDCPNVTVNVQCSPRKHTVFGTNLLVWAHGDKINAQKWSQVVAAEFPKQWGETTFRHVKLGHIHHKKSIAPVIVDEQPGVLVEYLEALCATDAWHAGSGFVGSQKGASAFEYHRNKGLLSRFYHVF